MGLRSSRTAFPSSYDLRTRGKVPPVGDQGSTGACWAFAAMGALESSMLPGDAEEFSEDNLVLNSGFAGVTYQSGGNVVTAASYLARWTGPVLASQDAFDDHYTPPGLTAAYHVQNVFLLPPRANQHDNGAIKSALMKYGAVEASMYVPDETLWEKLKDRLGWGHLWNSRHDTYYYNGSKTSNHSVDIVGWNDNYSRKNFATKPPGNGAFIVRNSWGTGWGDGGYFYVSFYDTRLARTYVCGVFDGAEPTDNFRDIYQYDVGPTHDWAAPSDSGWMANNFTGRTSDLLSAVSFWADVPGSRYTVYAESSTSSTLTAEGSGTLSLAGYHTVDLASPLQLVAGQRFRVAVKLTTPGEKAPVYLGPTLGPAGTSQSFVSADGRTWTDVSTLKGDRAMSVCLKAFTRPSITSVTSPGTDSPPATLGPYTMQTFSADPSDEGTSESSIIGPTGAISFDSSLTHDIVGSNWQTWSNGYAGDVYADDTVLSDGSLEITITLPPGTGAFYLYAEPDIFQDFSMSATAQDGTTSGMLTVQGNSGAQYFGFYSNGGTPISTVQVTDSGGDSAAAIGEFGIAPLSARGTTAARATARPTSVLRWYPRQERAEGAPGSNTR